MLPMQWELAKRRGNKYPHLKCSKGERRKKHLRGLHPSPPAGKARGKAKKSISLVFSCLADKTKTGSCGGSDAPRTDPFPCAHDATAPATEEHARSQNNFLIETGHVSAHSHTEARIVIWSMSPHLVGAQDFPLKKPPQSPARHELPSPERRLARSRSPPGRASRLAPPSRPAPRRGASSPTPPPTQAGLGGGGASGAPRRPRLKPSPPAPTVGLAKQ